MTSPLLHRHMRTYSRKHQLQLNLLKPLQFQLPPPTRTTNPAKPKIPMSSTRRLVVFGGNGFLGTRICRTAALRNWSVTSISRSGTPDWKALFGLSSPPDWSTSVAWHKGDVLDPTTYKHELEDATAVVHSLGILFETDYKGVVNGQEPILGGLKKAFGGSEGEDKSGGGPLGADRGSESTRGGSEKKGLTYEAINRDSAITLATEASKTPSVKTLLYVSAASGFAGLPSRYISTKREAESAIAALPSLRPILLRPGFIYDSTRPITVPMAGVLFFTSTVNSLLGERLMPILGSAGVKPLKVDAVAQGAVWALEDEEVTGVVGVKEIETYATKVWREEML